MILENKQENYPDLRGTSPRWTSEVTPPPKNYQFFFQGRDKLNSKVDRLESDIGLNRAALESRIENKETAVSV